MDESDTGTRHASRALIVDEDGRVLLAEHETFEGDQTVWVGLGGGVEAGESLHDALVRELDEEAGLVLRPDAVPALVWIQRADVEVGAWTTIQNHYFLIAADAFEAIPDPVGSHGRPLDAGMLSMRWWTPEEIDRGERDPGILFSPRDFPRLFRELLSATRGGTLPETPPRLGL